MPVAAREASVYTAMTIAEYYRSMGLKVLLMADLLPAGHRLCVRCPTVWRSCPGRMLSPMDLSAIVANFYARAGFVHLKNNATGSVTFIGTVSPAGGKLEGAGDREYEEGGPLFLCLWSRSVPTVNVIRP